MVFGGGGTRGAYQVGVMDAMMRAGIVPDVLVGTSAGAINATYWAFHPDARSADGLLDIWLRADRSVVVPPLFAAIRQLLRGQHLVSHQGLLRLLQMALRTDQTIEEAAIPLTITATDPEAGRPVRLRYGPAIPAVLASTAVPALFPPVLIGDQQLVDGGVVANCDIDGALEKAATDIVAVDIMGAPGPLPGRDVLLTVERTLDIALGRQTELAVALGQRHARIVLIRAPASVLPRFGNLDRTRALFMAGRHAGDLLLEHHLAGRRVRPGMVAAPAD